VVEIAAGISSQILSQLVYFLTIYLSNKISLAVEVRQLLVNLLLAKIYCAALHVQSIFSFGSQRDLYEFNIFFQLIPN
jgi:hypothetical protein